MATFGIECGTLEQFHGHCRHHNDKKSIITVHFLTLHSGQNVTNTAVEKVSRFYKIRSHYTFLVTLHGTDTQT
jgi:hypothetical protein